MFQKIVIAVLIVALMALTVAGCYAVDLGCKKIGGYFDGNTVFSVSEDDGYIYVTVFNYLVKLKGGLYAGSTTYSKLFHCGAH